MKTVLRERMNVAERLPQQKHKRVALIIDSMMAPRRTMMNGVARFMQEHEPWSIYLKPSFVTGTLIRWIEDWNGDGIIVGGVTATELSELKRVNVPIVDVAGFFQELGFCVVRADDQAIGRLGAEHLLERGFKQFAFCVLEGAAWANHRLEGFENRINEAGFQVQRHTVPKPTSTPSGPEGWENQQHLLGQWITSLPKPVGIMATTDFMGRQILEACQRVGVTVPDDVAVLGADNDEPICRISTPPLSSVIINDEQRGYEAASMLSEMMNGRTPAKKKIFVSPSGIKTRASTDVFAFDDELMVSALRYLREHVDEYTNVDNLSDFLGVSRSTLERKFRRLLGRSVNDEVVRLRVNYAIQLLSETQLPIKTVALRCGFSSQAYMSSIFKSKIGRTPGSYRH